MEIAVLGGGNGSMATAVDLSQNGHTIRLWRRNTDAQLALRAAENTLVLKDFSGSQDVKISNVCTEISNAVEGAELIVCPTPATAQPDIARSLAGCLRDNQVVLMPPGSFGSWIMARAMQDAGNDADVSFAESGTLPYLTRMHNTHEVAITTRATRLPTGVFPTCNSKKALAVIKKAYPSVEDCGDALSGALMNAGPIIHPPLIIMNAGPIEHFKHWDIHNEGTQPAVRRVTTRLDDERIAVREALGYGAPHFALANHYDNEAEEWMYGNAAHEKLTDSGDWREDLVLTKHRYMREDIETGLALLVSIADWVGVPAPTATGLLALGSAVCKADFRATGRTMETLGIANKSVFTLQSILRDGI